MSKKLAILYTGKPDNFAENSKTHSVFFENFDVDVYVSTWDYVSIREDVLQHIPTDKITTVISNEGKVSDLIWYMIQSLDTTEEWKKRLHRCMINYYLMEQAYNSIQFPQRYDIILRLRFDTFIHPNKLSTDTFVEHTLQNNLCGWRDRFNYGTPSVMNVAAKIFSMNTDWYIGDNRRNIELVWLGYLKRNNIELVETFNEFTLKKGYDMDRDQTASWA